MCALAFFHPMEWLLLLIFLQGVLAKEYIVVWAVLLLFLSFMPLVTPSIILSNCWIIHLISFIKITIRITSKFTTILAKLLISHILIRISDHLLVSIFSVLFHILRAFIQSIQINKINTWLFWCTHIVSILESIQYLNLTCLLFLSMLSFSYLTLVWWIEELFYFAFLYLLNSCYLIFWNGLQSSNFLLYSCSKHAIIGGIHNFSLRV